jgi:hypothetical protein
MRVFLVVGGNQEDILLEGLHQLSEGQTFRMEDKADCEGSWLAISAPYLEGGAWTISARPVGAGDFAVEG